MPVGWSERHVFGKAMTPEDFEKLNPLVDDIAEKISELMQGDGFRRKRLWRQHRSSVLGTPIYAAAVCGK